MAQQLINTGTFANDATGTPLQTGGQLINANFTDVYAQLTAQAALIAALPGQIAGNFAVGTFTGTLTGMTTVVTGTVNYAVAGKLAFLYVPSTINGTSNATTMTMTGLPAVVQPVVSTIAPCYNLFDNGATQMGFGTVAGAVITFGVASTTSVANRVASTLFQASASKGIAAGWSLAYPLA